MRTRVAFTDGRRTLEPTGTFGSYSVITPAWMGIIQNLLERETSLFSQKISFPPQTFSTKDFSGHEPDASVSI